LDTIANTTNIPSTITFDVGRIEVRAVKEEEIYCVADIITHSFNFDRGWRGLFTPLFKLGIAEDLRHRLRARSTHNHSQSRHQVCAIALYDDRDRGQTEIVGTVEVGVRTGSDRSHPPRYVYISNLAVGSDFRRQGVGRKLLNNCERITQSWGYTELHLHVMADNDQGLNLYKKLGYEVVSTEFLWSWFPLWYRPERLFMRKRIVNSEQ
jgi:ribosomal protein S18 acetylase RimI-like enzyme